MLDKKQHIRKYLKAQVGDPIVSLCDTEGEAIDEAVEFAAVDYWIALPYVKLYNHDVRTSCGELRLNVDTYRDLMIAAPHNEDAYFIGITREDLSASNIPVAGNQNYFDRYLLGGNVNFNPDNFPVQDPRYEADRIGYVQSTEDMLFGETDIRSDIITNELVVIHPPVEGQLHLWWSWGFCPEKTIEKIPANHLSLFRKMVALHFIQIVLASRTGVQLNADFTVDSTDLQAKRDRIQEELDKELGETANFVATWG